MLETSSPVVINTDGLKTKPSASCDSTIERWRVADIVALFELPFSDLMYQAQTVHRANFDANAVQVSTLLSIKTGG
jgi:biotin synthase